MDLLINPERLFIIAPVKRAICDPQIDTIIIRRLVLLKLKIKVLGRFQGKENVYSPQETR